MRTTLTNTHSDAGVGSSAEIPFSDCTFEEIICTQNKKFPAAVEEGATILRQKGLDSAVISCKSDGRTISNLDPSDRYIVDLNQMRKINPDLYNEITTGHHSVHYLCKNEPEVVVLRTTEVREIIKNRAKRAQKN